MNEIARDAFEKHKADRRLAEEKAILEAKQRASQKKEEDQERFEIWTDLNRTNPVEKDEYWERRGGGYSESIWIFKRKGMDTEYHYSDGYPNGGAGLISESEALSLIRGGYVLVGTFSEAFPPLPYKTTKEQQ